jgi:hypothetical protein
MLSIKLYLIKFILPSHLTLIDKEALNNYINIKKYAVGLIKALDSEEIKEQKSQPRDKRLRKASEVF